MGGVKKFKQFSIGVCMYSEIGTVEDSQGGKGKAKREGTCMSPLWQAICSEAMEGKAGRSTQMEKPS